MSVDVSVDVSDMNISLGPAIDTSVEEYKAEFKECPVCHEQIIETLFAGHLKDHENP